MLIYTENRPEKLALFNLDRKGVLLIEDPDEEKRALELASQQGVPVMHLLTALQQHEN